MRHTLILLLVSFLLTSCMKTQEKAAVSASSAQEAQTQGTQAVVKSAEALASSQATLASLTTILDEYIKNPSQDLQGLLTQVDLKDLENLPSLLKTMTEEMSKEISEEKMAPLLEALKYFTG